MGDEATKPTREELIERYKQEIAGEPEAAQQRLMSHFLHDLNLQEVRATQERRRETEDWIQDWLKGGEFWTLDH